MQRSRPMTVAAFLRDALRNRAGVGKMKKIWEC